MDEAAQLRTAGRPLLPRSIHAAGADCRHRLPEQGRRLRSLVQGFLADNAHDCGRSQAPGRQDRLHLGTPHLGSALTHHPHVHMIVPGGGLSLDGTRWVAARSNFLVHVNLLARLFRGKMLAMLMHAHDAGELKFFNTHAGLADKRTFKRFISPLRRIKWVVHCKAPFAGPEQVLRYLSRYTHRVAISNRRLVAASDDAIAFRWKDYRINGPGRWKTMRLHPHEFIRRFLLHVLPKGFHRIRHYGLFAPTNRAESIATARALLNVARPAADPQKQPDVAPDTPRVLPCPCPRCGARMIVIEVFARGCEPRWRPTPSRIDTS